MRAISISLLILSLFLGFGCKTAPAPSVQNSKPLVTTVSTNNVLTMLEASARFNTFNLVRTNDSFRQDFGYVTNLLNTAITTDSFDTITFENQVSNRNTVIFVTIVPSLNLLNYYIKNNTNSQARIQGLTAIETGIEKGLQR